MKKIPETFELDEDDIKEAIAYWLNGQHSDDSEYDSDFDITLKSESVVTDSGPGGRDYATKMVFTAVATKE